MNHPVFGLNPTEMAARRKQLVAGEILCEEGTHGRGVFILVEGRLTVTSGGMRTGTVERPFTVLCELSHFLGIPHMATLTAETDTTLIAVEPERVDQVYQGAPPVVQTMLRGLMEGFVEKEKKYLALLNVLEDRVNRRTESLRKANEELEEVNRFKNQMIGMAAHDLRSPIGALGGYLEIIEKMHGSSLPEPVQRIQGRCRDIAGSLGELIGNLLDVSLIESGSITLEKRRYDLRQSLRSVADNLRIFAEEKQMQLDLDLPEIPVEINADPKRVFQIMENLLSNAIKYSPRNSRIEMFIRTENQEIALGVKDQGPGIQSTEREEIYKEFYRTSNPPTAEERSSGLGLAIVKKLVLLHAGRIELDSSDQGSTFTVYLPA